MHLDAYLVVLEELTWEGIQQDIYQNMERCIAQMVIERIAQPPSYSLGVMELFQLSHFSSRPQVHSREGIISHCALYFFTLYEQHIVPRGNIPSFILYDVLVATCSIYFGYLNGGLWGKPHDSWCAPLTPHCTFIFTSYGMTVAEKKWLGKHLLFFF